MTEQDVAQSDETGLKGGVAIAMVIAAAILLPLTYSFLLGTSSEYHDGQAVKEATGITVPASAQNSIDVMTYKGLSFWRIEGTMAELSSWLDNQGWEPDVTVVGAPESLKGAIDKEWWVVPEEGLAWKGPGAHDVGFLAPNKDGLRAEVLLKWDVREPLPQ